MKKLWARKTKWSLALVTFAILTLSGYVLAVPPFNFGVHPFEFDPFQTKLVSAQWVNGAGCPTGATTNDGTTSSTFTDDACPAGTGDPQDNNNKGLVLFKTGPTPNFAASGAFLTFNQKGFTLTEIGYDLRKGSHCGAGAPRFNIRTTTKFYFLGCNSPAPTTTLPGEGWNRLTWGDTVPVMAFCVSGVCAGVQPEAITEPIASISIIFDEGQDAAGGPDQSGTAVLDNINVNGTRQGKP